MLHAHFISDSCVSNVLLSYPPASAAFQDKSGGEDGNYTFQIYSYLESIVLLVLVLLILSFFLFFFIA